MVAPVVPHAFTVPLTESATIGAAAVSSHCLAAPGVFAFRTLNRTPNEGMSETSEYPPKGV